MLSEKMREMVVSFLFESICSGNHTDYERQELLSLYTEFLTPKEEPKVDLGLWGMQGHSISVESFLELQELAQGEKIMHAIKLVRDLTGLGLKEAEEGTDRMFPGLSTPQPAKSSSEDRHIDYSLAGYVNWRNDTGRWLWKGRNGFERIGTFSPGPHAPYKTVWDVVRACIATPETLSKDCYELSLTGEEYQRFDELIHQY